MSTFHNILQRSIVTFFVLCFVFVSTYVPQSWNDIKRAEATPVAGATFPQQLVDNVVHVKNLAASAASAAYDVITSAAANNTWIKEFQLDGLAWMLAKQVVSQVTSSIVKWINSGFQGSPAFVQDLEGFLLQAGDVGFGKYLEELGGPFSFVCSPFKLDIQIALTLSYAAGGREGNKPTCTLTGALQNIEKFVDGDFNQGGWDAWFKITSNPSQYTDLGSLLDSQLNASVKIANAKGEQQKILDFGEGFLSSKICETVQGKGTTVDNCFISTPGKVINEALTFQLSTGQRSLIAADEFSEIIGALIGQIGKQALTGAAGLLGLSGGTGYTRPGYAGGSYVEQQSSAASTFTIDPRDFLKLVQDSLNTEVRYRNSANTALISLDNYANNLLNDIGRRTEALKAIDEIQLTTAQKPSLLDKISTNIQALNAIIAKYFALPLPENDTPQSSVERAQLIQEYLKIRGLHSEGEVNAAEIRWQSLVQ